MQHQLNVARLSCLLACLVISILLLPALDASADRPLVLRGDLLFSEAEGSILVTVDQWGPAGRGDGSSDLLFVLQRQPGAAFPEELPSQAADSLLYFDRQRLVVRGPDLDSDFVFTLVGDAASAIDDPFISTPFADSEHPKTGPRVQRPRVIYEGVGLILQEGAGEPLHDSLQHLETDAPALAEAVAGGAKLCPWGSGNSDVDCWSGGCGATSCEGNCNLTAGCSVTCAEGYFACCECDFNWDGRTGCKCFSNTECGC